MGSSSPTDNTIALIEVMSCRVPLREPVQLGIQTIKHRDYVAVRLVLDNGVEGFAYGYERGLPLFELASTAARAYLGGRASMRQQLARNAQGPTPAPWAAMIRGTSLCDMALWDAWSRNADLPLWALLGGARDRLPVMPVIGYGMTPERAARDGADLAKRGFGIIKLMIHGGDIEADEAVICALAEALPAGVQFGIDAHWSWSSLAQALPYCKMAERLGAVFVEDPFPPAQFRSINRLSEKLDIPLAVGEDAPDVWSLRELADAGDILRVDASVHGGVSGCIEAIALARAFDRQVIPHVFPSHHVHLGLAAQSVRCIEAILPELGADPIEQYLLSPIVIENGHALATSEPGAGLKLDWPALTRHSTRKDTLK
jgi:L-alanine-DL-glutamate epimerase-like enolase superfamily enzyme